jgi:hypothetical protein
MHISKIRYDGKSEKFCKILWELNRAYLKLLIDDIHANTLVYSYFGIIKTEELANQLSIQLHCCLGNTVLYMILSGKFKHSKFNLHATIKTSKINFSLHHTRHIEFPSSISTLEKEHVFLHTKASYFQFSNSCDLDTQSRTKLKKSIS